jgi:hypothetical protein
MSKAQLGRTHSDETKAKMSKAQSGENHPSYGKTPYNKGIPMSDEQKKKMRATRKRNKEKKNK